MLILQVVMQAESLDGKMLSNHRHPQVGPVTPPIFLGERVAVVPSSIRSALRLCKKRFPVFRRTAALLPIGARILATMIEESIVVVLHLQRQDFVLYELVEFI